MGLRRPLKEGVRGPPRPPKSMILGHFDPFRAKNGQSSRFRPEIASKDPPKTHFFIKFRQNPGYPPWKLKFRKKTSRFRPEIFQNFRKVMEKGALFGQSWDFGAPYRISGVKRPDLPCQYPQPPALLGPSYEFDGSCVVAVKGSQRLRPSRSHCTQGKIARICYEISPPQRCQYPQPPALLGPSYVIVFVGFRTVKGSQRLRPS